ncbi:hypothetical protein SASPL_155182 [Salvia splendens]|uniref:DnaJ homologue subfamily C member 28 conserved domain-containing protein n=1 Tax=Salvia splendens TaxID=180675 RepID=A0A8X8W1B6_SALSN|nr:hypothetical protein SASPL_155182 [Salvia splendens]
MTGCPPQLRGCGGTGPRHLHRRLGGAQRQGMGGIAGSGKPRRVWGGGGMICHGIRRSRKEKKAYKSGPFYKPNFPSLWSAWAFIHGASLRGRKTSSAPAFLTRSAAASRRQASSSYSPQFSPKSSKKVSDDRLPSVIDAVNDRKLPPELRGQRNNVSLQFHAYSPYLILIHHNLQRVWHAMEEGQFENLPGKGKPLDLDTNPHADPAEDTVYRILNKNGCAPEWVELNKEIRNSIAGWRIALGRAWTCKDGLDDSKWLEASEALKLQLRDLNNKVFRYNLIVPFGRQMFGF